MLLKQRHFLHASNSIQVELKQDFIQRMHTTQKLWKYSIIIVYAKYGKKIKEGRKGGNHIYDPPASFSSKKRGKERKGEKYSKKCDKYFHQFWGFCRTSFGSKS
jgi:hypothetical protein